MPQPAVRAVLLLLFITGFASRLPAQTDPEFVISLSPSIVTVTQGSSASLNVHIAINERPSFEFSLSGLPAGVIAQVPTGRAGSTTIVLTALPTAATGSFNVALTAVASGFDPPRSGNNPQSQNFTLNVKPMPVAQWEYRMERAGTNRSLNPRPAIWARNPGNSSAWYSRQTATEMCGSHSSSGKNIHTNSPREFAWSIFSVNAAKPATVPRAISTAN